MTTHATHEAIYLRVSSNQQTHASQLPELTAWADRRREAGHDVEFYTDSFTGKTMKRPGWELLMEAMRAGRVTTIACWRLDRLGRTTSGLTTLFDELLSRDVNLVSLRDGIDLGTAAGRLMAGVLASMAQYETEIRGERIKAGMDAARAKGKKCGGGKPGRRVVKPRKAARIQEQYVAGATIADIAKLNGISRGTVYNVLADFAGATNG